MSPPPIEITTLARICRVGDLDDDQSFHDELESFERKGHRSVELWPVLFSAVRHARPQIIKLLFSRGLAMNQMYIKQAIQTRSRDVFQAFIDSGWDVNEPWVNFHPPVLACFVDDIDFMQRFFDRGADPDVQCFLDVTPLSFAVRSAEIPVINLLLDRGSIHKGQLFHHSVERSENVIEVLQMMIARGASINEVQYSRHLQSWGHEHFKGLGTTLHRAVELGERNMVEFLLRIEI
ncbi:Ankyrin repeat protein [Pyrenophora tritici-repentis]|nr:Ankyrin repeat protein [Pyrenophora tritici-repentis]